jgi:hypothetical protein
MAEDDLALSLREFNKSQQELQSQFYELQTDRARGDNVS